MNNELILKRNQKTNCYNELLNFKKKYYVTDACYELLTSNQILPNQRLKDIIFRLEKFAQVLKGDRSQFRPGRTVFGLSAHMGYWVLFKIFIWHAKQICEQNKNNGIKIESRNIQFDSKIRITKRKENRLNQFISFN